MTRTDPYLHRCCFGLVIFLRVGSALGPYTSKTRPGACISRLAKNREPPWRQSHSSAWQGCWHVSGLIHMAHIFAFFGIEHVGILWTAKRRAMKQRPLQKGFKPSFLRDHPLIHLDKPCQRSLPLTHLVVLSPTLPRAFLSFQENGQQKPRNCSGCLKTKTAMPKVSRKEEG